MERYWFSGARRAIYRHSAQNVPSMPVSHVKTASSITLHSGQGERDRKGETGGRTERVSDEGWTELQRSQSRNPMVKRIKRSSSQIQYTNVSISGN